MVAMRTGFLGPTDADLVHLAGLTNLTILDLNDTQVTDAGLVHLGRLANLFELHLDGTHVTDAGLVDLKGLINLSKLNLNRTEVTDAGLVHLAELTNLRCLYLDRSPLAGVVREFESQPAVDRFLSGVHARRSTRLRQAVGVLVRMIMERRGWQKTGRKGSLGLRAAGVEGTPTHNTGGLAFWFVRAERYERSEGMPFRSVRERCQELDSAEP